jgi:hypothetical protein
MMALNRFRIINNDNASAATFTKYIVINRVLTSSSMLKCATVNLNRKLVGYKMRKITGKYKELLNELLFTHTRKY